MEYLRKFGVAVAMSLALVATAAYAASTFTLGTIGTSGGVIVLSGATSGSATIQVAAAAGTGTVFQLPATNGTNNFVLKTDGSGITSWTAAGAGDVVLAANNVFTGKNTFGSVIGAHTTVSATGNIDLSASGGVCGTTIHYTGASAGTLTVLNTAVPDCNVAVDATSTGLATIAAAASGTVVGNTACAATPRTKEAHSVIWVHVESNAGTAPVINVSGDCG